jgi:hypothetical protein
MARRLSRNQRQNLARRDRKEEEEKRPSTAGRIVLYLRAATALSSAFSAVTLMLLPDAFPYFVALVYAAILFWTADLSYELRGQGTSINCHRLLSAWRLPPFFPLSSLFRNWT